MQMYTKKGILFCTFASTLSSLATPMSFFGLRFCHPEGAKRAEGSLRSICPSREQKCPVFVHRSPFLPDRCTKIGWFCSPLAVFARPGHKNRVVLFTARSICPTGAQKPTLFVHGPANLFLPAHQFLFITIHPRKTVRWPPKLFHLICSQGRAQGTLPQHLQR